MMNRLIKYIVVVLIVAVFGGCATYSVKFQDSSKGAKLPFAKDFYEYWDLRAKNDGAGAFKKEAPYMQVILFEGLYKNYVNLFNKKALLTDVEILSLTCENEHYCNVEVKAVYEDKETKVKEDRYFGDLWIKTDSGWYHIVKNPVLLPQVN